MFHNRVTPTGLLLLSLCLALLMTAPLIAQEDVAAASIANAEGDVIGRVTFTPDNDNKVLVAIEVSDLSPGFHGFHIHAVGNCDSTTERAFTSAGGHFNLDAESHHGAHTGDLPSLLVNADGTAVMSLVTDRFTIADLLDEDGSAVIIHAGPDNFAHIPADRYVPEADQDTRNTGDAGGRVGCGVIASE